MAPTAPKPPNNVRTSATQTHAPYKITKSCCDNQSNQLALLINSHNIDLAQLQSQHALYVLKIHNDHYSEMYKVRNDANSDSDRHINEMSKMRNEHASDIIRRAEKGCPDREMGSL